MPKAIKSGRRSTDVTNDEIKGRAESSAGRDGEAIVKKEKLRTKTRRCSRIT